MRSIRQSRLRFPPSTVLLVTLALSAGCTPREGVQSYTVRRVALERPEPPARATPGQAWFFKLLGSQAAVQAETDAFAALMASVRFDEAGLPHWQTPSGWTERKETTGMRFATLIRDESEPPLEIAVSSLPSDDPGGDEYLKSNIDRWRGQVGLSPYEGPDWKQRATDAGEFRESETANGRFVLVQLSGQDSAGEPLTMLAAIVPRPAAVAPSLSASPADLAGGGSTPTYQAPAEWTSQPPRQFQAALWSVSQGDRTLEISVSQSGGSTDMNIARWRNQVGLGPSSDAGSAVESIAVGGRDGTRVELRGAEQTIVGVIVPQGGTSWFFKLMGPADLVDQERERFQAFVQSVQFP